MPAKTKDSKSERQSSKMHTPIAIVATGALFAQSKGSAAFWQNIVNGKDLITEVPSSHWLTEDFYDDDRSKPGKINTKRGSFISALPFDPMEFGIPPNTISATDSAQLLSLVVAKQLLAETLSVRDQKVSKERISVILGAAGPTTLTAEMSGMLGWPHWEEGMRKEGLSETQIAAIRHRIMETYPKWTEDTFPGCLGNVIAGRIANRFDLKGTNCIVDAACAGGLAAIKMAIMELETGEADLAITGGVDSLNDPFMFSCFSKTGALSKEGDCRPFSDKADGTMLGEGIALFALRRLEDAERDGDQIFAIIRSIGSASDGKGMSVYAPMAQGQELTLRRAYDKAGYGLNEVEMVEAHGTGTSVGDMVEFQALSKVFLESKPSKMQLCALGSVKAQVGHTKASAGAAGLFKAVMSLHHKVLPGIIKVDRPNPKMNFQESPLYLNTQSKPWIHSEASTRKAGVSAFGFGGTDFHVCVEEYRGANQPLKYYIGEDHLLLLAADNGKELLELGNALIAQLDKAPLMQIAKDSQQQFSVRHKHRLAVLAKDKDEAKKRLALHLQRIKEHEETPFSMQNEAHYGVGLQQPKVALLFAGQGSQYCGMGKDLAMTFDSCRKVWDRAADLAFDPDLKLHEVVFPISAFDEVSKQKQEARLKETLWAQPAIGAVALSQLSLLNSLGMDFHYAAGHSSGEIPALFAGGIIANEHEMLTILRKRGELMKQAAVIPGAMTAVFAPADQIQKLIDEAKIDVAIANFNSPKQQVVSGAVQEIETLEQKLGQDKIRYQRLPVASAFHSKLVQASVKPFAAFLDTIAIKGAKTPVFANTTADIYPKGAKQIKELLANQLAKSVRFQEQVDKLYADGVRVFVELGPQAILTGLVHHCLENKDHTAVSLDQKGKSGLLSLWNALATLAASGVELHFKHLWEGIAAAASDESIKRSPATIQLNGSLYGKPYPPAKGAAAKTAPNHQIQKTIETIKINDKGAPIMAHSDSPDTRKFGPPPSFGEGQMQVNLPGAQSHHVSQNQPHADNQSSNQTRELAQLPQPMRRTDSSLLHTLQVLQTNALSAQRQFQQALTESHRAYLKIVQTALHEIGHMSGAPNHHDGQTLAIDLDDSYQAAAWEIEPMPFMPMEEPMQAQQRAQAPQPLARVAAPARASASMSPVMPQPQQSRQGGQFADMQRAVTQPLAPPTPRPPVAPAAVVQTKPKEIPAAKATVNFQDMLFDIVAENTGYPKEMLELDTELEAGLGIDSIKRVEILSALQEKVPDLEGQDTSKMTQLKTLREILDFVAKAQSGHMEVGVADSKK